MAEPWVIITGASGFLGGQLVRQMRKEYRIYALDRRRPQETHAPEGPGIEWFQVDLGDLDQLRGLFEHIRQQGGAELLLHLAGYYDFSGEDSPEYQRTNVVGTRNVLELAEPLRLRRLIFTSSIAACPYPAPGAAVTELIEPSAGFPYARSKQRGEALVREYRDRIRTCIVRPAAIFSDWCEYEPLYVFLKTWCSHAWNARVLGGQGESAVPYLHVEDLLSFLVRVTERAEELPSAEVLQASPDGCTTHAELFREATRCFFGAPRTPFRMPLWLVRPGLQAREILGRITGRPPFERPWMADFIDLKLNVDASRTRRRLDWAPNPDLGVLARMPRLIGNMRAHREEWRRWNRLRRKVRIP